MAVLYTLSQGLNILYRALVVPSIRRIASTWDIQTTDKWWRISSSICRCQFRHTRNRAQDSPASCSSGGGCDISWWSCPSVVWTNGNYRHHTWQNKRFTDSIWWGLHNLHYGPKAAPTNKHHSFSCFLFHADKFCNGRVNSLSPSPWLSQI